MYLASTGHFKIEIKYSMSEKTEVKERFSLVTYLKNSYNELKKVTWPTREETTRSTIVVVLFTIGIAAFLGIIDYGFNELLDYALSING